MQSGKFENRENNYSKLNITGIHSPANQSYRQSLYVAAIAETLGYKGLASPVVDVRDGVEYSFDFYQPEDRALIKVFKGFDEQEYCAYRQHDALPILIFDSESILSRVEVREFGPVHTNVLIIGEEVAKQIYRHPFTYIYHDGSLWGYAADIEIEWVWERMVPVLLRKYAESSEDEELPF